MSDSRTRRAFALWTQAQPAVSAFVFAVVGDRRLRDEILQDVALAVLESIGNYDSARPFLPWVFAIARNKIADARRARGRFPALLDEAAESSLASAVAEVAEGERDRLAFLDECLQRLEGRSREVCDLHYRGGLAPGRIAALLAMQPNTVSKTLQRVREQLRGCIEERLAASVARGGGGP